MNRFEPKFSAGSEAQLYYQPGAYQIKVPGEFVRCAVTGKPIPLDLLRYWNADVQEAYASAQSAFDRHAGPKPDA